MPSSSSHAAGYHPVTQDANELHHEHEDVFWPEHDDNESVHVIHEDEEITSPGRAHFVRALALLCACSLSIGSHYASYILGPLKSRLSREMGTSNTEFSLLISAFSLNSTWTPLVGGLLASRLGTTFTSIMATGVIFLGQALLLCGNLTNSVRLMAFGLFVFGLGVSPLAVVQETIIVRFFKSHGLGVSLALGLVAGKGASFVAARTSYPLSKRFGQHAPFYASTLLTAISFAVNLIYLSASRWLVKGTGVALEASELHAEAASQSRSGSVEGLSEAGALKEVAKKRMVYFNDITKLGDIFWAYIGLNVLCGAIWAPFTHLVANIIERRYHLEEEDASTKASYVLAGSIFLYPIIGLVVDRVKERGFALQLFLISSCLTFLCYTWLALPPTWTKTPIPAILSFATGQGFAPLLLVIIVPQIVPSKYVSTTLGAHKSLEQTGSTIFQTLAGLALDVQTKKVSDSPSNPTPINGDEQDIQHLLNAFLFLNGCQLVAILGLTHMYYQRRKAAARRANALLPHPTSDDEDDSLTTPVKEPARRTTRASSIETNSLIDRSPVLSSIPEQNIPLLQTTSESSSSHPNRRYLISPRNSLAEHAVEGPIATLHSKSARRGEVYVVLYGSLIAFAWVLFIGTAWMRLRSKEERGGGSPPNSTQVL